MYHIDTNQLAILRRKHINHHGNLRFLHFYAKICEDFLIQSQQPTTDPQLKRLQLAPCDVVEFCIYTWSSDPRRRPTELEGLAFRLFVEVVYGRFGWDVFFCWSSLSDLFSRIYENVFLKLEKESRKGWETSWEFFQKNKLLVWESRVFTTRMFFATIGKLLKENMTSLCTEMGDRDSLAFICLSRKPVGAIASRKTQEITPNIKNQRAFENNIRSFRGNHDLHLQFVLPLPLPMFVLYA